MGILLRGRFVGRFVLFYASDLNFATSYLFDNGKFRKMSLFGMM